MRSTLMRSSGRIHYLMNVDVHGAGNARDAFRQLLGDFVIRRLVAPGYLDVDGGGKAEVQNLVGDIGGFEEEPPSGNFSCRRLRRRSV